MAKRKGKRAGKGGTVAQIGPGARVKVREGDWGNNLGKVLALKDGIASVRLDNRPDLDPVDVPAAALIAL